MRSLYNKKPPLPRGGVPVLKLDVNPTTNKGSLEYSKTAHNKQYDLDLVFHLSCLEDTE
jgi:hypothetical protein